MHKIFCFNERVWLESNMYYLYTCTKFPMAAPFMLASYNLVTDHKSGSKVDNIGHRSSNWITGQQSGLHILITVDHRSTVWITGQQSNRSTVWKNSPAKNSPDYRQTVKQVKSLEYRSINWSAVQHSRSQVNKQITGQVWATGHVLTYEIKYFTSLG